MELLHTHARLERMSASRPADRMGSRSGSGRPDARSRPAAAMPPRTEERDFYEALGASRDASAAELRTAFREAVLRHHPDRSPASTLATQRTAGLNRAWNELRDPVRRMHYDR